MAWSGAVVRGDSREVSSGWFNGSQNFANFGVIWESKKLLVTGFHPQYCDLLGMESAVALGIVKLLRFLCIAEFENLQANL